MKKNNKNANNLKTRGAMWNPYFGKFAFSMCKGISLSSNYQFSFTRKVMPIDQLTFSFLPPCFKYLSQNQGVSGPFYGVLAKIVDNGDHFFK